MTMGNGFLVQPGHSQIAARPAPSGRAGHGGPRPLKLLLPVWGSRHVRQFLELSLPSWLSPGNLPAVTARGDAVFVFLTSAADRDLLRARPELAALERLMPVEFMLIDDLIVPRNHSTVLTLAWERAIRQCGDGPSATSFVMLLSDVLYADGTLGEVVTRLDAGTTGVMLAGLHVVREAVEAGLLERIATEEGAFACPPRPLVRWALEHMHPSLAAAFVDQPISHSIHPNNLFWRIDDGAAVGRYFCTYLIGVAPERDTFEISAPLDYCFVPELCPSGNVVMIDDSDHGFFVECAARDHEAVFLAPGPLDRAHLVASLARWTTAEQRGFCRTRVIFHAGPPPPPDHPALRRSDDYVEAVRAALPEPPQPHRDHPYWGPQLSAWTLERARDAPPTYDASAGTRGGLRRLAWIVAGRPPTVRRWHPFWRDYAAPTELARTLWPRAAAPLVVSDLADPLPPWLFAECPAGARCRTSDVLAGRVPQARDGALLVLGADEVAQLTALVTGLTAVLPVGAPLVVHIVAHAAGHDRLASGLVRHAGALVRPGLEIERCIYVGGRLHGLAQSLYRLAARLFVRGGWHRLIAAAALLSTSALVALADGLRGRERPVAGDCSAATILARRR